MAGAIAVRPGTPAPCGTGEPLPDRVPVPDLHLEQVRKSYGRAHALRGVDLHVPASSFVVLTGANGAGKTTLLRIAAGLVRPGGGSVRIGDVELRHGGPGLRRLIGFASHASLMYGQLTAAENLMLHARLFGLPDGAARVRELTARLGVEHVLDRGVGGLSRGTVQRLSLVRALLHDPAVLLLDEPYAGLDDRAARSLTDVLAEVNGAGQTIVASTHDRRFLDGVVDREVVLDRGRILADRPVPRALAERGQPWPERPRPADRR